MYKKFKRKEHLAVLRGYRNPTDYLFILCLLHFSIPCLGTTYHSLNVMYCGFKRRAHTNLDLLNQDQRLWLILFSTCVVKISKRTSENTWFLIGYWMLHKTSLPTATLDQVWSCWNSAQNKNTTKVLNLVLCQTTTVLCKILINNHIKLALFCLKDTKTLF